MSLTISPVALVASPSKHASGLQGQSQLPANGFASQPSLLPVKFDVCHRQAVQRCFAFREDYSFFAGGHGDLKPGFDKRLLTMLWIRWASSTTRINRQSLHHGPVYIVAAATSVGEACKSSIRDARRGEVVHALDRRRRTLALWNRAKEQYLRSQC